MAYRFEENGDVVIDGFQNGIADSPESGLTDVRNVEIITVPGEAPINLATTLQTTSVSAVAITSASGATINFASGAASGLLAGQAIFFPSVGSLTGVSTQTPYWISSITATSATLSSTYITNTAITFGGTVGGATFSTYNVGATPGGTLQGGPTYFAYDGTYSWCFDRVGQVWSTITPLGTVGSTWSYTGNKPPVTNFYSGTPVFSTNGNGLVFYEAIDGTGYLFVFHGGSIDYTKTATANLSWNYQYDPSAHASGSWNATPTKVLNTGIGYSGSHMALVGQDNAIYYCDGNTVGSIVPTNNGSYDPTTASTYTWNGGGNVTSGRYALQLPAIDIANCLTELGTNLLVGGQYNLIYPWNRTATTFSYPIFLSENNVSKMITVNTNTFIFIGNRGRIHITNGSQVQFWKKVPDHLSGTIIPYFTWGGAAFNRNELFFSFYTTANDGTVVTKCGGVYSVNLDTKALRLVNKLSYGSYAGYASAITTLGNSSGAGLHIGWSNGIPATQTSCGIDSTSTTPYTGGEAIIVSDLIPIGTFLKKKTPTQFEFKFSMPLLSGESAQILAGTSFADYVNNTFTSAGTLTGDGTSNSLAMNFATSVDSLQWLLVKVILTGKSFSPSYNRLTQIRVVAPK